MHRAKQEKNPSVFLGNSAHLGMDSLDPKNLSPLRCCSCPLSHPHNAATLCQANQANTCSPGSVRRPLQGDERKVIDIQRGACANTPALFFAHSAIHFLGQDG